MICPCLVGLVGLVGHLRFVVVHGAEEVEGEVVGEPAWV